MLWIGITGAMGSGKSTAAKVLMQMGFPVLDADRVVHGLLTPGGVVEAQVIQTFGQSVCASDGHLDRRALGRVVFEDAKKLDQLEKILHPKVRTEVARRRLELEKSGFSAAFYDVPLLFEKNMEDQFDAVLVISATEKLRRERVRARTGLSDAELEARFQRQLPLAEKEKRASAVVDNNGSEKDLEAHLRKVLEQLEISVKNPSSGPA